MPCHFPTPLPGWQRTPQQASNRFCRLPSRSHNAEATARHSAAGGYVGGPPRGGGGPTLPWPGGRWATAPQREPPFFRRPRTGQWFGDGTPGDAGSQQTVSSPGNPFELILARKRGFWAVIAFPFGSPQGGPTGRDIGLYIPAAWPGRLEGGGMGHPHRGIFLAEQLSSVKVRSKWFQNGISLCQQFFFKKMA